MAHIERTPAHPYGTQCTHPHAAGRTINDSRTPVGLRAAICSRVASACSAVLRLWGSAWRNVHKSRSHTRHFIQYYLNRAHVGNWCVQSGPERSGGGPRMMISRLSAPNCCTGRPLGRTLPQPLQHTVRRRRRRCAHAPALIPLHSFRCAPSTSARASAIAIAIAVIVSPCPVCVCACVYTRTVAHYSLQSY